MSGLWLLDVNVLVALFNPDHIHHDTAHDWFAEHHTRGWATCPLTEQGVVRILANPSTGANSRGLRRLSSGSRSSARAGIITSGRIQCHCGTASSLTFVHRGPSSTHGCLPVGLAKKMKGRLATFDQTIPLEAVIGASKSTVAVISAAE